MVQRRSPSLRRLTRAAAYAAMAMACAGLSCARPPAPPPDAARGATPNPGPTAAPPIELPEARPEPGAAPEPTPIAMKPLASAKSPAPQRATPASSLGGHDRRLVHKPFDSLMAADFELGPLSGDEAGDGLAEALDELADGLVAGELPYERFSEGAAAIARILYASPALDGIRSVRFARPRRDSGGVASVELRVFSEDAARSSLGLAILTEGEAGSWRVEHFELDLAALGSPPPPRAEAWDPYSDR